MTVKQFKNFAKWFYYAGVFLIIFHDIQLFTGFRLLGYEYTDFYIFCLGAVNVIALYLYLVIPVAVREAEKKMKEEESSPLYISKRIWDTIRYLDPDNK